MGSKLMMGIQVIPQADDVYSVVDAAIAVIAASGLRYEVTPMETVIEGSIEELLDVAKKAHRACLEAGARSVMTQIKMAERAGDGEVSIDKVMAKYR